MCCVDLGCQRGAHQAALSLHLLAGQREKKHNGKAHGSKQGQGNLSPISVTGKSDLT